MIEQEVILELKNGNKEAFELLYRQYWLKVYNFTKVYIMSSEAIKEVVQEVFIKIWESHALIDETKNIEGFLFIITRNLIFNDSRRSFNEVSFQNTMVEAIEDTSNIEQELEASDLSQYLNTLLQMLTPRQREIFKLSREEHLTYKEIAVRLELSERTVENHIANTLKFLKKNLQFYSLFISI